ncbi:hypothetical protein FRACYDRAFT_251072 [Fragilariopsis cylindrus CCMP1102]|uniref:Uncharacterized protein n=1 Tax=Fragilariopsis cylindrus CCMP1102 TaxID=635003 RepID=A0A1E7EMX6_9STRA|nr:hypothetical protein FRACYDRAFT_251072 [Fragilariopsis cylindrus CCMP1102]|eukprot:OEU07290.1 hypothetical protein FRACYDRAFT_251072 [Fragilariopsis cylindrus CCMP1102]
MYLASYTCDNCSYIEYPEDPNHADESELVPVEERKMLCLADIWFGSVKTAEKVIQTGYHCTMITKTAHIQSPKKVVDDTMQDFPGITWIVIECTTEELNYKLMCIGQKYN